jgi:hypothetical protein
MSKKTQPQVKVLQGFKSQTDQELATTAATVIKEMTGNAHFPTPAVDLKTLQAALDNLNAAVAAQAQGGTAATAHKHSQRSALIALLSKEAHYVQDNCNNDPAILLSSGFQQAAGSRSPQLLPKPSIVSVDNRKTTVLTLKVTKIANARCFEVHVAPLGANNTPGTFQSAGFFTSSRAMKVTGLTPGTTYVFQVRALGSTGFSDWSDAMTHMCS